jgi:hypothetical protein
MFAQIIETALSSAERADVLRIVREELAQRYATRTGSAAPSEWSRPARGAPW